jgi:hypothetical protein
MFIGKGLPAGRHIFLEATYRIKCARAHLMREIRTSGLMSGDGKRGGTSASVLAPILDSTNHTMPVRFKAAAIEFTLPRLSPPRSMIQS